jgi:hypothetical protein
MPGVRLLELQSITNYKTIKCDKMAMGEIYYISDRFDKGKSDYEDWGLLAKVIEQSKSRIRVHFAHAALLPAIEDDDFWLVI